MPQESVQNHVKFNFFLTVQSFVEMAAYAHDGVSGAPQPALFPAVPMARSACRRLMFTDALSRLVLNM